jgi:hypothetical protein
VEVPADDVQLFFRVRDQYLLFHRAFSFHAGHRPSRYRKPGTACV